MEKPKIGRNDPCVCGSGKKYKKCCEEKVLRKKFQAEVIKTEGSGLSSLFKKSVVPVIVPPAQVEAHKEEDVPPQ